MPHVHDNVRLQKLGHVFTPSATLINLGAAAPFKTEVSRRKRDCESRGSGGVSRSMQTVAGAERLRK